MKKLLFLLLLLVFSLGIRAQKHPTIMILPSDNWCAMRYFMTTFNNQGTRVKVPNYSQAFQEDTELSPVISKVGGILTGLGYSIKDAEQELHTIAARTAEDNVTIGKNSGVEIAESPLDQLKKRAKADILIQIWWKVNREGSGRSVTFTLEAFDTYSSKRIATSTGTGLPSYEIVPVQLERAISDNIAEFDKQMMNFYSDTNTHGREIVINIKRWEDWSQDLETEFGSESLLDIIQDWLHENTVNDEFGLSDATENFAMFEQVRIPLLNDKGRAIDARTFVSQLQRFLRNRYNIPSKLMMRGLGEANLILGEQ